MLGPLYPEDLNLLVPRSWPGRLDEITNIKSAYIREKIGEELLTRAEVI